MTRSTFRPLVWGGSGFLGRYLMRHLAKFQPVGTATSSVREGLVKFDCENDDLASLLEERAPGTTHVIVLQNPSSMDECVAHPEASWSRHVTSPIRALRICVDRRIIPVFASSDAIFDGSGGAYQEIDLPNPITAYGRQNSRWSSFFWTQGHHIWC